MSALIDLMDAALDQIETTVGTALTNQNVDAQFHSGRLNAPSSTPAIDIYPGVGRDTEARYFTDDYAGGGYLFTVRARLSSNDYEANQRILYQLMDDVGDLSVAQAVGDDPTFGGVASSSDCINPSGEQVYVDPGGTFYGFEFTLRVIPAFS